MGLFAGSLLLSSCSFEVSEARRQNIMATPGNDEYSIAAQEHGEAFMRSFATMATSGVSITVDQARIELGAKRNNIITIDETNKAKGMFYAHGLSLHDICLDLHLPLQYNGLARGLDLTLADETLFFSVFNADEEESYDVKYKTSLAAYDTVDESGNSVDSETGGIYQYEYGDLDWIIDDILETLSGERLSLGDASDSASSVDVAKILDSLNEMEEGTYQSMPYFVWNLPIGDTIYPVGLRADASYEWSGIDFPSKSSSSLFELSDDVALSLSASIETASDCSIAIPEDAAAYRDLRDSMDIFHKVIHYVNEKKFSIYTTDGGLSLRHYEAAQSAGSSGFARDEIDEAATLSLDVDIDFTNSILQDIYADLIYTYGTSSQYISARVAGDGENAYDEVYLALNDLQKAKTSKTVLDALMGSLDSLLNNELIQNESLSLGGGLNILGTLGEAIDAIKNSNGVTTLQNGTFDGLLQGISLFKGTTDEVILQLDLSVFGAEGGIIVTLIGPESDPSLASIEFLDAAVGPFFIDGTIMIGEYERTPMTSQEEAEYTELRHLESVGDQIAHLADAAQVHATLSGYVLKNGTSSVVTNGVQVGNKTLNRRQGFTFGGGFGFDLVEKEGTGSLTIVDRKEQYVNDHNLKIDVTGPEPRDENGEFYQTDTEVYASNNASTNWMFFEYNSKNASKPSGENRTDPESSNGLKGRFAIHSLNGMFDVIGSLLKMDDPRLERITRLLNVLSADSLVGKLMAGKYFEVLGSDLVTTVNLGDNKDVFALSSAVLGGEAPMTITVTYNDDVSKTMEDGSIRTIGGNIKSIEVELSLDLSSSSDIYLKIDIDSYEMGSMNWPNPTIADFTNFSSLKALAEHVVGIFKMGERNADNVIVTSYHLSGSIDISIPIVSDITVAFNAFIRVEGSDVRLYALLSLPIKGVMNSESVLKSGNRYVSLYFHTSGNDDGTFLIDRWDDYGDPKSTNEDYHYQTRLTSETFGTDPLGFIMKDILGMNNTVMNLLGNTTSSSSDQAMHGEDIIKGFTFNNNLNSPKWTFTIGTSALAHSSLLGDLSLNLNGSTNTGGDKVITSASGSLSILSVIDVSFNLTLDNVSPSYHDCWNDTVSNVPYNIKVTNERVFLITRTYYETQYGSFAVSSLYSNNFMTFNSAGNAILAPSFASLPLATTPNSHL